MSRVFYEDPEDLGTRPRLHLSRRNQVAPKELLLVGFTAFPLVRQADKLITPTVPVNHCGVSRNQQNRNARPILLFHANVFEQRPALNTLIFFKVKVLIPQHAQ